jgi:hypothetical protein
MSYDARMLADSVSPSGHRLITMQVTFPRLILAEFNTHRVLSRNSASSRAIPVERRLEQIRENPFVPEAFGKNQRGMQAGTLLDGDDNVLARERWLSAAADAVQHAHALASIGVHKQHANRVIETYAWHTVIVTATEWENWDALRVSRLAQPEMFKIAGMMREVRQASVPLFVNYGDWHLPLVRGPLGVVNTETHALRARGIDPVKVCVGRCAAVSFERHEETTPEKANAIYDKLSADGHMSPFEHACRPMSPEERVMFGQREYVWTDDRFAPTGRVRHFLGNLDGWVQARKMIRGEDVYVGPVRCPDE